MRAQAALLSTILCLYPYLFLLLLFFFRILSFFLFFPTASNNRVLPRTLTEALLRKALLFEPWNPTSWFSFYYYCYIYISLFCHPYRSGAVNFSFKIQYCYSYRLTTISFRSSCNFLNKVYTFTITVSSRLCHLQFCRIHQFALPDNKHGQDSGDPTNKSTKRLPPNLGQHMIAMHTLTRYRCMLNKTRNWYILLLSLLHILSTKILSLVFSFPFFSSFFK